MAHPILSFIEKNGEGIQHLCLQVDNINDELDRLNNFGITPLNEKPHIGGEGNLVIFLNPKTTKGILIEPKEKSS